MLLQTLANLGAKNEGNDALLPVDRAREGTTMPALWEDRPYSLWNLYQMLQFNAHDFFRLAAILEILRKDLVEPSAGAILSKGLRDEVSASLNEMNDLCTTVGLRLSKILIDRTIKILADQNVQLTHREIDNVIEEISIRVQDELSLYLFMHIPHEKVEYFSDSQSKFGKDISLKFPSSITDVEEAGKSYATGRNTACVFHLSRVMESGLRVLGNSVGVPDPNPTWEHVLKKCDAELAKPVKDRSTAWKIDDAFFSEATANLRAVKSAWRNPTMHVGSTYSDEVAEDILGRCVDSCVIFQRS